MIALHVCKASREDEGRCQLDKHISTSPERWGEKAKERERNRKPEGG